LEGVTRASVSSSVEEESIGMSITLTLNPETEKALQLRATERGVSLTEFLSDVVEREIASAPESPLSGSEKAKAFLIWADSFPDTPLLSDATINRDNLYPDRW
jgi:hypothetical protein